MFAGLARKTFALEATSRGYVQRYQLPNGATLKAPALNSRTNQRVVRRALSGHHRTALVATRPLAHRLNESFSRLEGDRHHGKVEFVKQAGVEKLSNRRRAAA